MKNESRNDSIKSSEQLNNLMFEIIDNSNDLIAAIDSNLHFLMFNKKLKNAVQIVIGIEINAGDFVFNGVNQTNIDLLKPYFLRGLNGEYVSFEYTYWIGDNSYINEIAISPLHEADTGKIYGIGFIGRDITSRIKAKEQLHEAHEKLSLTHQVAKLGSWRLNRLTGIISLSKEKQMLMGFPDISNDSLEMPIIDYIEKFVFEEDKAPLIFASNQVENQAPFTPGEIEILNYRFSDNKGNIKYMEVTSVALSENIKHGVTQDITDRKIAEQKLLLKQEQLHAIIENTEDNIWLMDDAGKLIIYNSSYRKFFEKNASELIENSALEERLKKMSNKTQLQHWKNRYAQVNLGNRIIFEETININGEIRNMEITLNPVMDNGKVIGVTGISRDVTERKQAEQEVVKRKQQLSSIIENTKDSIWLVDVNGKMVLYNSAAKQTLKELFNVDFRENATIQDRLQGKLPDDYVATWQNRYGRALLGRQFTFIEEINSGSKKFFYEITLNPVKEGDKITGVTVFARDLTRRINAESAVIESENRLNYALAATGDGVWDWNILTGELYNNPAWLRILEFEPEQYHSNIDDYLSCLQADEKKVVWNEVQKCLAGKIPIFRSEHKMVTKKGNIIYVLDRGKVVEWADDGKPARMVGSLVDISPRKKQEFERARLIEELTKRNNDLEQFTYIISHDLRSPVAKILGLIELVKENYDFINHKEFFVETLSKEALNFDEVIRDLNNIVSIRKSTTEGNQEIIFAEVFEKVIHSFSNEIEAANATIETDFKDAEKIQAIKSYVYSMFYNLLSNALKYRQPHIPLQIKVRSHTKNDAVEILFEDNGLGMDLEKNHDKVFGLYKRFHRHINGKGMGLYITKNHIELMDGTIEVQSEPDKGTMFKIYMPQS